MIDTSNAATADVIIPVTSGSRETYMMSAMAVRTCRASTNHPIHVLDNNSGEGGFRAQMEKECRLLGVNYRYVEGPFSITRFYNMGMDMTSGKYVALGNADVIYYPNWLENLIDLWEEQPEWFALCNYTFDPDEGHPCVHQGPPERRIVPTHNPSSGVIVFKRENEFRYDERFKFWEMDADLTIYMESKGLRAGVCLNSRCDHLIAGIRDRINQSKNMGMPDFEREFYHEPKKMLKEKWGSLYKGA